MFTGIISGTGLITSITDFNAIRTLVLEVPESFSEGLSVGASVSVDGVCLTATEILSSRLVSFDVVFQTLRVTTLSEHVINRNVNVERAARDGAEIGGHPISGHIDFSARILDVNLLEGNKVLHLEIPADFGRYIFAKGYIAINGASLTVAGVNDVDHSFEIWLIPETRRVTALDTKVVGDYVNVEIERGTQVIVDTIRSTIREEMRRIGSDAALLISKNGIDVDICKSVPRAVRAITSNTGKEN